jgi:hypothetical protein
LLHSGVSAERRRLFGGTSVPAAFGLQIVEWPGRNAHPRITLIAQILILESKIFDYEDENDGRGRFSKT